MNNLMRQNLRTAVLLLALPAAFTASAQAADLIGSTSLWPTEGQWKALSGISDPTQTGLDGRLDLVGGGSTPVAYWMVDATGVYFRVRINAPEVTTATAPPGALLVMIDLLGDGDTGPEYAFSWDGYNASRPNTHGLELTAISPPSGQQGVVGTTWAALTSRTGTATAAPRARSTSTAAGAPTGSFAQSPRPTGSGPSWTSRSPGRTSRRFPAPAWRRGRAGTSISQPSRATTTRSSTPM